MWKKKKKSDEESDPATPNTVVLLGGVSIREERILSDEGFGAAMSRSVDKDTAACEGSHTHTVPSLYLVPSACTERLLI